MAMLQFARKIFSYFPLIIGFALILIVESCQKSVPTTHPKLHAAITSGDLKTQLSYLDSGSLKNSLPGTPQEADLSAYISDQFQAFGLLPAGNDSTYFQEYITTIGVRSRRGSNYVEINRERLNTNNHQVLPWPNSTSGKVESVLAWAGYGLDDTQYNDYTNLDSDGKILLIMNGMPAGLKAKPVSIRKKIAIAESHGAAAVLIVDHDKNGRNIPQYLDNFNRRQKTTSIPVMQVTSSTAQKIVTVAGWNFTKLTSSDKPDSKVSSIRIEVSVKLVPDKRITRNVVGLVPGYSNSKRYFVISAFYNRIPTGEKSSVDNGRSVAGLLELAQYFAHHPLRNNLLFVAFSGENQRNSGADYFADNPTIEEKNITGVIGIGNIIDGREKWNVVLSDATDTLKEMIQKYDSGENAFQVHILRADSSFSLINPFRRLEIPVSVFTNSLGNQIDSSTSHTDEIPVLKNMASFVDRLDTSKVVQTLTSASNKNYSGKVSFPKVTLGLLPDYNYKGEGLRISKVNQDRPAQQAGLQKGDIIISLNGEKITGLYDYMRVLDRAQKGQQTTVQIRRDGHTMKLTIKL